MASVSRTLRRIKDDLRPYLSDQSIRQACHDADYTWRERKLGPVKTVHLFVLQVLCFNTAMTHLRHLADAAVKAPAYCRARMRLPLAVLQHLLRQSSSAMRLDEGGQGGQRRWCGLRAYLVDGSSTIAPDTPDSQKAFGQPRGCKKGCGFPVPKVLALFDAFSGMIVELMAFPLYTHEQSRVWLLHSLLGVGDLLVGDRGFCSFAHAAMLNFRGVEGLFRLHQKQITDFRPHRRMGGKGRPKSRFIKRLGKCDQIVEWFKPDSKPKWMSDEQYEALPKSLKMRELRYRLPCKGQRTLCVTIATTLLDSSRYSKEDITKLYNVRWTAETHFAELKTTLKMRKVKSMTAAGVRKELAVYCLVYNLVHAIMLQAAARQGVTPDRISFIDTVRWLLWADPGDDLPDLIVNPKHLDRHEPRVTKDRQDTYPKMCQPRATLRKALKKQAKNA
jgi:hypothetical protein